MDPIIHIAHAHSKIVQFHFRGVGTLNQNHHREYQNAPSCLQFIAEHSICQPGRPAPQGKTNLPVFFRHFPKHEIH